MKLLPLLLLGLTSLSAHAATPPEGFTPLFNGKDLSGWRGGSTYDHRKLLELPEAERDAQIQKWTASMTATNEKTGIPHWRVENEELINDGFGDYATTEKDYGNFELHLEYKTVPLADSGIYLRGVPQVQIWDSTESDEKAVSLGKPKGSGGLWNNSPGTSGKDPLVKADKPFGEWNQFRIHMIGSRVSIWLNDQLVVDHAILENYYDKKLPADQQRPVPAKGPIQLQTHGGEIRWRNVFVREIPNAEAVEYLRSKTPQSAQSIFNGKDLTGWAGDAENYEIIDQSIRCKAGKGGNLYWNTELSDFTARLEFLLPPAGNNGLAIRYPGKGGPAYEGMTEIQILDDNYDKIKGPIKPQQVHGSAYGLAVAQRGYQFPIGEWNHQTTTVKGSTINVELNGVPILNTDLSKIDPSTFMDNKPHPGLNRSSGYFGFAGHNDPVAFRQITIEKP
ncbi:DUF1080 domain-containing protein [Phragmitibacter flavus]|uniref:DUF1080 domain-containing protein n=1 Tax=Phragmitibacter flavus TaxID=2576071 RepID=A0A5R8KGH4_9BACT|nr:DUF1080 domain-containing protein [Phragmitibacter flavus]TLD71380.1 DUF1080 domain-containing protein [Phragmitibacter flavus]